MKCKASRERISRSFDEPLTNGQRAELENHAATCVECESVWAGMRRAAALFRAAPRVTAPPNFANSVLERLAQREQRRRKRQRFALLALAAASLIVSTVVPVVAAIAVFRFAASEPVVVTGLVQAALSLADFVWEVGNGLATAAGVLFAWLISQPLLPTSLALGAGLLVVWVQLLRNIAPAPKRAR